MRTAAFEETLESVCLGLFGESLSKQPWLQDVWADVDTRKPFSIV